MTETSTGRPYWLHPQTKEARWEPPPRRGAPGRPQRHPAEGGGPPPGRRAGEGPGASPTGSREPKPPPEPLDETSRVRASVLEGLRRTEREEIGSRKKNYKFLLLQWHPDKNPDKAELATEIFQFLQQQRDWYLKE
ncbi:unnamed protein product [Prorocentrum cordatum]|uniref:WW domain-containing protein n=1 Tax=Prorocentrum cordatum TaxID=2364126 RepID=A0ABN9QFZ0_9DINO|nr:unnamed protein product [Polarella glacialis]